ncbi:uncharacterized protein ACA1_240370 [Acanthamoeba castellanii str. Neff]|uniref:Uncharacterized protein n=1 Tax=Acanthamoeba castellanii (strain ATCC 30010 / Neff) TaxID=1257118 RepID=L8GJV2_ACACF|nr:uncharacterized protein ACA1_240370 [Acanthamoeba castellanii str. Neff]ELR13360.1 hypothetical protein ACA1_240370 [Acanthamoeba castellanii str. Neff]
MQTRRGHIVIWDAGQAHCNFPNNSPKCRIYQFVRMMPALKECAVRDKHSPFAVVQKYPNVKFWEDVELTPLGRKLVGLDPWD